MSSYVTDELYPFSQGYKLGKSLEYSPSDVSKDGSFSIGQDHNLPLYTWVAVTSKSSGLANPFVSTEEPIWIMALGSGVVKFKDLEQLTFFPLPRLPQVLTFLVPWENVQEVGEGEYFAKDAVLLGNTDTKAIITTKPIVTKNLQGNWIKLQVPKSEGSAIWVLLSHDELVELDLI